MHQADMCIRMVNNVGFAVLPSRASMFSLLCVTAVLCLCRNSATCTSGSDSGSDIVEVVRYQKDKLASLARLISGASEAQSGEARS